MSLAEYFTELDADLNVLRSTSGAAFDTLSESSDLDELKAAFAVLGVQLRAFLDAVAGDEPPAEAQDVHTTAVTVGREYLALLEGVDSEVQETATLEEFIAAAGNDELQRSVEDFNAQCPPLQQVADDNGVDVDLDCPT